MRDALASYFNLTLLFFFILLVSGFVALSFNYTKAYRVKNNVLTQIEKYEGHMDNQEMLGKTRDYVKSVGYVVPDSGTIAAEKEGYTCARYNGENLGWCYKKNAPVNEKFTVDIVVFVNINIPIINRVFASFKFFWMTGGTNAISIF